MHVCQKVFQLILFSSTILWIGMSKSAEEYALQQSDSVYLNLGKVKHVVNIHVKHNSRQECKFRHTSVCTLVLIYVYSVCM
jgi:hypothetical protein